MKPSHPYFAFPPDEWIRVSDRLDFVRRRRPHRLLPDGSGESVFESRIGHNAPVLKFSPTGDRPSSGAGSELLQRLPGPGGRYVGVLIDGVD